ncbi:MAG: ABC transporter permease, partial [Gemmatimonadales bacterium]
MRELFRDRQRDAQAHMGGGVVSLWCRVLLDLCSSAAREHGDQVREWCRNQLVPPPPRRSAPTSGDSMFETLRYDLRHTFRMLRKSPTFTVVAILVIALGSGAVTTIFSAANALILRPLPQVTDPARVFDITRTEDHGNGSMSPSYPFYTHIRDEARKFDGIAAWAMMQVTLSTGAQGTATFANMVSANYFTVLGVRPQLGRFFVAEEDRTPGAHPVIVLSDGFWHRRFGADRSIVGKSVMVNGAPYTVIGVAPHAFSGVFPVIRTDAWVPLMMASQLGRDKEILTSAASGWLTLFGRLKPGV